MGRRIEDLPINDQPHGTPSAADESLADVRETAWFRFVGDITDLLDTGEYGWAEDTLTGIQETVERTQQVSEAQRRAIANIIDGHHRWRWSR